MAPRTGGGRWLDGSGDNMPFVGRREHRFVVRMWLEDGLGFDQGWRGAIEHVGHERRLYFSSIGDLVEFIRARTAARDIEPVASDRDMR